MWEKLGREETLKEVRAVAGGAGVARGREEGQGQPGGHTAGPKDCALPDRKTAGRPKEAGNNRSQGEGNPGFAKKGTHTLCTHN